MCFGGKERNSNYKHRKGAGKSSQSTSTVGNRWLYSSRSSDRCVNYLCSTISIVRGSKDKHTSFRKKVVLCAVEYAIMYALEILEGDKDVNRKRVPDKNDS